MLAQAIVSQNQLPWNEGQCRFVADGAAYQVRPVLYGNYLVRGDVVGLVGGLWGLDRLNVGVGRVGLRTDTGTCLGFPPAL